MCRSHRAHARRRSESESGFGEAGDPRAGWREFFMRGGRHGGGFGGQGGDEDGGGFGVRRPLRFLAYKLELDEKQVGELAKILDELKTERAQVAVDDRRSLADFAEAISEEAFDSARAMAAGERRVVAAPTVAGCSGGRAGEDSCTFESGSTRQACVYDPDGGAGIVSWG